MRSESNHFCTMEGTSIFEFKGDAKGVTDDSSIYSLTQISITTVVYDFTTIEINMILQIFCTRFPSGIYVYICRVHPPTDLFKFFDFLLINEFNFVKIRIKYMDTGSIR